MIADFVNQQKNNRIKYVDIQLIVWVNEIFLKKSRCNCLQVSQKAVPLQPLSRNNGSDEKKSSLKDFG